MTKSPIHKFSISDFSSRGSSLSRRQLLAGASSLALAGALAGHLPQAHAAEGVLRTRTYSDMRSLDPAFSQGIVDEEVQALMYSKLIQYKPGKEWGWQLDAAASIDQVDTTHIKFALRDDVGFSDGFGAMTAEDVKYSFERIIDPNLESTNKPDMAALSHVEVTGERTGVIVLKNPFQPLWSISLPYIVGNIVSKAAFEAAGGKIGTSPSATSGPYLHKSWEPKQKTTLVPNPDWKGDKHAFEKIEIFHIDDEKAAEIAYEAGELDFTRVSSASLARLQASPPDNTTVVDFPSLYYTWLGMNLEHPKLQSLQLRQAIQHAVDIPSILEAAYFGHADASTGIIAPGLLGHRAKSLVAPEADVAKAKQLLAESGEKNVSLTLSVINKQSFVTAAQIIQANLAAIGINLEVKLEEAATFWASGDNDELQLVLNRYSMTPDPYYATSWFTCEQVKVWNWERYCDPEFDRLHEAAQSELDNGKRDAMYQKAQDLMEMSGAYKFVTHESTPSIYRNTLRPALRPDGLPLYRYFAKA